MNDEWQADEGHYLQRPSSNHPAAGDLYEEAIKAGLLSLTQKAC
jgi:hypothetical protein